MDILDHGTEKVPPPVVEFDAGRFQRPATIAAPSSACHAFYSGACVPTGFSDVDCAGGSGNGPDYVSGKIFRVVGADVYGLDSDCDGIACESR